MTEPTLNAIALETGTDKSERYHGYTVLYERYLSQKRHQQLTVLEIGVGEGASLRMWRTYFPNARIFGLDHDPNCQFVSDSGIHVFIGDQSDPACLAGIVREIGSPDIVIDDGSHIGEHQIISFECLFPFLHDGGLYIVEDLHAAYWGLGARSAVAYFQELIHAVNLHGRSPCADIRNDPNYPTLKSQLGYFEQTIESLHFYRSIVFIQKRVGDAITRPSSRPQSPEGHLSLSALAIASPQVAIVVPVHNALHHVQNCLSSIIQTCPHVPLIVIDDGSDAETQHWLCGALAESALGNDHGPRFLLRNERQQLFTRSVNRGIRWAYELQRGHPPLSVDFVAVVNSDCELYDNWLQALLIGMDDPRVGIVGYPDCGDGEEPAYREMREPDFVAGHCILLRMKMLEEIGVFCETDTDGTDSPDLSGLLGQAHVGSDRGLSWRANRKGWRTLYCHCALSLHHGGRSWHHDLNWLAHFDLKPLWPACDCLDNVGWEEGTGGTHA